MLIPPVFLVLCHSRAVFWIKETSLNYPLLFKLKKTTWLLRQVCMSGARYTFWWSTGLTVWTEEHSSMDLWHVWGDSTELFIVAFVVIVTFCKMSRIKKKKLRFYPRYHQKKCETFRWFNGYVCKSLLYCQHVPLCGTCHHFNLAEWVWICIWVIWGWPHFVDQTFHFPCSYV